MLDGLGMAGNDARSPDPGGSMIRGVHREAYRHPGGLDPLLAGVLGSVITTWVTFTPCFLWIFWVPRTSRHLRGNPFLSSGLSAITAAVVGVVLNLAVWFSLNTLFSSVTEVHRLGMRLLVPTWSTLDVASALIAVGASPPSSVSSSACSQP